MNLVVGLSEILVNQKIFSWRTLLLIGALLIVGCQSADQQLQNTLELDPDVNSTMVAEISPTQVPTTQASTESMEEATPKATLAQTDSGTPDPAHTPEEPTQAQQTLTMGQDDWKSLPAVPEIGSRVKEIFKLGLSLGNNPNAFAKVGDCGSSISWFLGPFDEGPEYFSLGDYAYLEPLVEKFAGSFGRYSVAARNGFNASSVFAPLWSDPTQCNPGEGPLACEYRVLKPSFAFIMLGTNDRWHIDTFESNMRQIIEFSIEQGVVPIIGTKADNFEEDESINRIIANLAREYEVPLWNYWLAVQSLPNQGLEEDGVHLTWGPVRFDNPENLHKAWPVRNLTAMQMLDAVWAAVADGN